MAQKYIIDISKKTVSEVAAVKTVKATDDWFIERVGEAVSACFYLQ